MTTINKKLCITIDLTLKIRHQELRVRYLAKIKSVKILSCSVENMASHLLTECYIRQEDIPMGQE